MAADPTVSTPGKSSLAVGTGAVANGQQAVAVGNSAEARRHSVAVGQNSKAQGQASTALGAYSHALAYHTEAVGTQVTASKQGAIAVGRETVASTNLSVAIGKQAKATDEHAVALGDNATTRAATQETDATVGPMTYGGFAGDKPIAVVSVGQADQERQLVNVGAGNISTASTDAINGSQLYATNAILGNVATSTVNALGGGAVLNATTGEFEVAYNLTGTNPSTSEPTGTTYSSVGDALTALSTAVNQPITTTNANSTNTTTYSLDLDQATKDQIAKKSLYQQVHLILSLSLPMPPKMQQAVKQKAQPSKQSLMMILLPSKLVRISRLPKMAATSLLKLKTKLISLQ